MKKWMIALGMIVSHLSAAWNPPVFVSDASEEVTDGPGPDMDANAQNNGVAVWPYINTDLDEVEIKASNYFFGSGWSTPFNISSLALNSDNDPEFINQDFPAVAMNNLGDAVAVWQGEGFYEPAPHIYVPGVFSASRSPNGTYGPVQRISALDLVDSSFFPHNPNVDINDAGLSVAVWLETRVNLPYVMASFLEVGGSWTTPAQLDAPTSQASDGDTPDVVINQRGDVAAAWRKDGSSTVAVGTYSSLTNTWTSPLTFPVTTGDEVSLPRVGIDESGNAVAMWSRNVTEVLFSYFTNGSGWSSPAVIFTGTQIFGPEVVMDRFGNATAVWSSGNFVYASDLPFGGTWSTPVVISNFFIGSMDTGLVQKPIAVDLDGNVIVLIYRENSDGTYTELSVSKFVEGGWQTPLEIFTLVNWFWDNVGIGSCGFALALWQNFEVENNLVQAADNFTLYAPILNLRGSTCCERFAFQKVCFNTLTWDLDPCAVSYQLFRNGVLIATLGANVATFTERICQKGPITYSLIAVSSLGGTSLPATVILP